MGRLSDWLKRRSEDALGMAGVFPAVFRAMNDSYVRPHSHKGNLNRLKENSDSVTGVVCFLLVVGLAVIDLMSVPKINFTVFYLMIVAFASWNGSRKAGLFIVLLSSLALFVHEVRAYAGQHLDWAFSWNVGMQIAIYLAAAFLVSAIRNLTENLERRVHDRTAELEREVAERQQTGEQLFKTMQQFRQLAENITDAFWMREAAEMRVVYVSPAYETIWGHSCKSLYQSPNAWLEAIHPEDRDRVALAMRTKQSAGEYSQEYRIVRPDATLRWIRDRAFPIRDGSGKVVRIVGIAEDITERRRLEREILEISDREQGRIGQDLHDSLCQKLVSIAFDNNSLERKLASRSLPEAATAQQIASVLDDVITEARAVARGLFPVQLETDGLKVALEQLAATVSIRSKINCQLECPEPVSLRDNVMATHLYRIAQEAVNNGIKHGQAKNITIQLQAVDDLIELNISDDGAGIPVSRTGGMGLHIMDYRARTIGGTLSIGRGPNGTGTTVTCCVRQ